MKTNEEFKIKFRGVRGSYPIAKSNFLTYGGNTACIEVNVAGHLIILDAGTGLIDLGDDLLKEHLSSGISKFERKSISANLLLSHIHQDHIQGFTFFKPANISTTKIDIYGSADYNENLTEELSQLLFAKTFPLDLGDIAANMNIYDLNETECIILDGDKKIVKRIETEEDIIPKGEQVIITSYKSYAHPQDGVMIYKIAYKDKTLVYATDKESYVGGDKKLANFARNCDLLIHDAQYTTEDYLNPYSTKQGFGHSTFEMAIEAMQQSSAKKIVFFHLDPTYDDVKLKEIETHYNVRFPNTILAHEGLEISL